MQDESLLFKILNYVKKNRNWILMPIIVFIILIVIFLFIAKGMAVAAFNVAYLG